MFKDSRNTEEGLVRASLEEFIACWRSKQEADFSLQFREGKVRLNFSCSLGDPDKTHVDPSLRKRNYTRAAAYSRAQRASKDASPALGLGDQDKTDVDFNPAKRIRRKSPRQIARNNARAAEFSRAQRALKDASPVLPQPPQGAASDSEDSEEPASRNVRQCTDHKETSERDWAEDLDKTVPLSPDVQRDSQHHESKDEDDPGLTEGGVE